MSQFGESCRSTPSLFYQKHSFCEPCYSFAPQTHLLHYMGCVKSPQICPREARIFFLLGLRASKSLGLPNPSLSAPQRRRKTPTWQMEDLLGRKGEDMKTKSGKKYHSSNARPSSTAAARRGSSGEAAAILGKPRVVVVVPLVSLSLSCRRCPPSIHEFL